jgi:hypothetical protein
METIANVIKVKKTRVPKVVVPKEMPSVLDIGHFMNPTNDRASNDKVNKVRECIIENLFQLFPLYCSHAVYGDSWTKFQQMFMESVHIIYDKPFHHVEILKMAGRKFNYDFKFLYKTEANELLEEKHIEFKHGAKSIRQLPQFLSLNIKNDVMPISYAEYYYANWIDKYIECDEGITEAKPDAAIYKKMITGIEYKVHPFFQQLYDREIENKERKNAVVNESIKQFLETYGQHINLDALTAKLESSQGNKTFLLWDTTHFHIESMNLDETSIQSFEGILNNNTILVRSHTLVYKLLLRWRNHKGILNPAWQISIM